MRCLDAASVCVSLLLEDSCAFLPKQESNVADFAQNSNKEPRGTKGVRRKSSGAGHSHLRPGLLDMHVEADSDRWLTEQDEHARRERLRKEGIFAIPQGDVFSVAKILEIAGVSLDESRRGDGSIARDNGLLIEVDIVYSNMHPFASTFGDTHVTYYYDIRVKPVRQMKTEFIVMDKHQEPGFREIEERYGVMLSVRVMGTFGFFSSMYLLIMLTTALGLLAAATVITDKFAMYCLNDDRYVNAMIDQTAEFNDNSNVQADKLT
mmetsp:Transcript_13396/g.35561  ORF Transcript_13396/g.35561 Transcript_13396/m.35561 type:complete len:264 (-) Transcript_13396:118-909(-)